MRKILFLFIIIVALFVSSSQSYKQQSLITTLEQLLPSKPLESQLSVLEIPYWERIISVEQSGYYYFVEFLIRKGAHFFTFGLLATAIYWVLSMRRYRAIITLAITLAFAIGDEFHQSLTVGRTPYPYDVMIDMTGAFTFIFCIWIFTITKQKLPSHKG